MPARGWSQRVSPLPLLLLLLLRHAAPAYPQVPPRPRLGRPPAVAPLRKGSRAILNPIFLSLVDCSFPPRPLPLLLTAAPTRTHTPRRPPSPLFGSWPRRTRVVSIWFWLCVRWRAAAAYVDTTIRVDDSFWIGFDCRPPRTGETGAARAASGGPKRTHRGAAPSNPHRDEFLTLLPHRLVCAAWLLGAALAQNESPPDWADRPLAPPARPPAAVWLSKDGLGLRHTRWRAQTPLGTRPRPFHHTPQPLRNVRSRVVLPGAAGGGVFGLDRAGVLKGSGGRHDGREEGGRWIRSIALTRPFDPLHTHTTGSDSIQPCVSARWLARPAGACGHLDGRCLD